MTITREDLAAAAAAGVLQYRQIDPLLVYLLQRDVLARRRTLAGPARTPHPAPVVAWLFYLAAVMAVVTTLLFTVLLAMHVPKAVTGGALLSAALLYLLVSALVVAWGTKRGFHVRMRVFTALAMVTVPLALLLVQLATG